MLDCHAHLDDEQFDHDLGLVLKQAELNGIAHIMAVSMNVESAIKILSLANSFSLIRPCAGLHPVSFSKSQNKENDLKEMELFIRENHEKLFCIGEVGLDFSHWLIENEVQKMEQIKAFEVQIQLAIELQIPLNVHSRNAGHYAVEILTALIGNDGPTVCFHAFDGKLKYAKNAAKHPCFYFSIAPIVVRDSALQKLVAALPVEKLLLESDAPALASLKNTRNTPGNISETAFFVAALKNIPLKDFIAIVTNNTRKCFPKLERYY